VEAQRLLDPNSSLAPRDPSYNSAVMVTQQQTHRVGTLHHAAPRPIRKDRLVDATDPGRAESGGSRPSLLPSADSAAHEVAPSCAWVTRDLSWFHLAMFRVSLKMFLLRKLLAADIGLEVEFALRFALLIQIWTTKGAVRHCETRCHV
jgi:hypothetical protein